MRVFDKEAAATVIQSSDGQVVFGRKRTKDNGPYSGLWVLPGGIIEEGEAPLSAARRETLEETGLDISELPTELVDDSETGQSQVTLLSGEVVIYNMRFYRFLVQTKRLASLVTLQPSIELSTLRWLNPAEIIDHQHCPLTIGLLGRLGLK